MQSPELMRLQEVRALTGWGPDYVDKLVENRVLTVWRGTGPRGWRFFYRSEIRAILGKAETGKGRASEFQAGE